MSLRGAFAATKQSPVSRGDCFAIARNDMQPVSLLELHSAMGEDLEALLPCMLRPSGGAFKSEL